ncbi:MAG: AAA family ATPase [Candidatus Fermentibacteraceae bacterium]
MKLRSLRIVSMPGFPRGGPVFSDLSPGMNVIIGANGAGKTTFTRAVRWLLWPSTADRAALRVISAQTFDNIPLEINQSYASGQSLLRLPPDSHSDCFTITADDLFDQGTTTFADRVKHAITGQVSVNSLYIREDSSRALDIELERHRNQYDARVSELEAKHGLVVTLPELREKQASAVRAERRLVLLEKEQERRALLRVFSSMSGMESALPTDLGNATRLGDEISTLKGKAVEIDGLAGACRRKLYACGLDSVPESLGEIRNTLESLKAFIRRKADLEERIGGLSKTLEGVPTSVSIFDLDTVLASGLGHERLMERKRELEARLAESDGRLSGLQEETLTHGRSLLARWLALKEHRDYIIPAGVLVLLAILIPGGNHLPAAFALLILAGSLLIPLIRAHGFQKAYSSLKLRQPASWTVHDVLGIIRYLEDTRADMAVRNNLALELTQIGKELGPANQVFQETREKMGVSSTLGVELVAARMKRFDELDGLKGQLENAVSNARGALQRLGVLLSAYGSASPDSLESAVSFVDTLEERVHVFVHESETLAGLLVEAGAVSRRLHEAGAEYDGIFQRNRLERGDFVSLKERDSRLQEYRDIDHRLKRFDIPDADIPASDTDLSEEIRLTGQLASTLDEVRDQVVLAMAAEAEMEKSVELVELLSLIQNLERKKDLIDNRNLRIRIRKRLLDTVKGKYQVEIQPPVVNRASGLLTRFTGGRYALSPVGLEDSEVAALDSQTGQPVQLGHLSRGTRMQLLLALKISFAELVEAGDKLPLVFDEVLANTDLMRFREVAHSMAELALDDRQLFYLTCQEPDASLIQDVFQSVGGRPVNVLRMDRTGPGEWPLHENLHAVVPEPGSLSYDEYARLVEPPGVVYGMPAGEVHPAWVLTKTFVLHKLLEAGLDSVGKAIAAGKSVLDPVEYAELEKAAAIAAQILAVYSRGRSAPLTRKNLEESPVGRSKLFEEAWVLSQKYGHSPEALLYALRAKEVPGFRTALVGELETFFTEQGLLSVEEPLSMEEAWVQVLASFDQDGGTLRRVFERLWGNLERGASTK